MEITAIERALLALATRLDRPYRANSVYPHVVVALTHRSRSLYRGFIHSLEGPAPISSVALLRPLVEIHITLRSFRRYPTAAELWVYERELWAVRTIDAIRRDPTLVPGAEQIP